MRRFEKLRTYTFVFCMPVLLVGVLLAWNNLWYARQESKDVNTLLISQAANIFDTLKENCDNLHLQANQQEILIKNLSSPDPDTTYLSNWITTHEQMSLFAVTIALYQRGSQNVFLNSGEVHYSEFEHGCNALSASLSGLYSKMNASRRAVSITLYRTESDPYSIAYLYPLTDKYTRIIGTLCILVHKTTLTDIFSRYFDASEVCLAVFDSTYRPLMFVSPDGQDSLKELQELRGSGLRTLRNKKRVALVYTSSASQQMYSVSMSSDKFYASSGDRKLLYPIIALCALSGFLAAMLVFKSHQKRIQSFCEENETLMDKLGEHSSIIRDLVLRKLIDGSIKDERVIRYNLQCANLTLDKSNYYIAVFFFDAPQNLEDVILRAESACSRFDNEWNSCFCFSRFESNQMILLLNSSQSDLSLMCDIAAHVLKSLAQTACTVSIGREHHSLLKLNHAYVEATVAFNEKMNPQSDRMYLFDFPQQAADRTGQSFVVEKALIVECVKNGNQALLASTLQRLFSKLSYSEQNQMVVRCACFDMINLCISLSSDLRHPMSEQAIGELCLFDTPDTLMTAILNTLQQLSTIVQAQETEARVQSKYNLIGFVQEHYTNPSLSLSMLSEQLHLSQPYISKLFKEETGQTFISYVKQIRLNHVKKALVETDLPVQDIIRNAGYLDIASFSRYFKMNEGITCTEYRRLKSIPSEG